MAAWDDAMLALVRGLIIDYYLLWGAWPTMAQLKAELVKHAA